MSANSFKFVIMLVKRQPVRPLITKVYAEQTEAIFIDRMVAISEGNSGE